MGIRQALPQLSLNPCVGEVEAWGHVHGFDFLASLSNDFFGARACSDMMFELFFLLQLKSMLVFVYTYLASRSVA